MKSKTSHWGKVFENNQYEPEWNEGLQRYDYSLRNKNTSDEDNRCVFEVSQEQYETLLKEIKE